MNNIKATPKKDCKWFYYNIIENNSYINAFFCKCGYTIYFKNKKSSYKTILINCKKCGGKILYG